MLGTLDYFVLWVVSIERKEDNQAENDHIKDAEPPKEILHLRSSEKIPLTSRVLMRSTLPQIVPTALSLFNVLTQLL